MCFFGDFVGEFLHGFLVVADVVGVDCVSGQAAESSVFFDSLFYGLV